jgi:hypothetical protein
MRGLSHVLGADAGFIPCFGCKCGVHPQTIFDAGYTVAILKEQVRKERDEFEASLK